MHLRRRYRLVSIALAGVACLGALTACGASSAGGQGNTPASTVSSTAGCADVTALKASLDALTKVRPLQDGTAALTTAITNVKTNLDAALASASATLQPQVAQVKTAFAALQTSVTGLTTDNLTQKLPDITAALAQVGTATAALASSVTQNCATS